MEIKKVDDCEYELPKTGKMLVPGKIFFSEKLLAELEEDALKQLSNIASLPGIQKYVIGLSDMHVGYGMPIGGVAAFDLKKGVVSPGMVGYDINCGVRVLATDISLSEFNTKRKEIIHDLKRTIPSGVGRGGKKYSKEVIEKVLVQGVEWAVENGFGTKEDLERCEENGKMQDAGPKDVSDRAISRGLAQLGTLGAGNHFIDIQVVDEIYDENIAKVFGVEKGKICIMIHCGSRGLGHQVASDYLKLVEQKHGWPEQDRELTNAPIDSELGKKYLSAMRCAVNFAFCNRQMIMHNVREIIKRNFPKKKTHLVYDIAHNIAKIEEYNIDGKKQKLLVVRKGATRSFGPGRKEIPIIYRKVGQPVIIPGSMSTPSFILVGKKEAEQKSFSSSAHGAGRAHSRSWAHKSLTADQVKKILEKKDIILEGSFKGTIEESELAYKNVEEVIEVTEKANLSKKVAKLKPIAVMIG